MFVYHAKNWDFPRCYLPVCRWIDVSVWCHPASCTWAPFFISFHVEWWWITPSPFLQWTVLETATREFLVFLRSGKWFPVLFASHFVTIRTRKTFSVDLGSRLQRLGYKDDKKDPAYNGWISCINHPSSYIHPGRNPRYYPALRQRPWLKETLTGQQRENTWSGGQTNTEEEQSQTGTSDTTICKSRYNYISWTHNVTLS